ncbi:hypothetical protein A6024_14480 [Rhodovulum sulfidophilum]|nr:hypothetical protein A6W98_14615 [Rhodovulum sulfidophilum DSM 1374]ANB39018.1 hypothetical protein A6024_14480 [Rhodovulum sulfidophilum]
MQRNQDDFDGAEALLQAWGNGLRPDPDLTVSEWADRHRMLSGRASAEPGRYRTVRTPYMREIMDRLSPGDPTQRIVFMKAAQVGATEAGNNWIGFAIHQAPGPMLAVQPTVELAKRNSRQRIDPLIDESPELRERVKPARSRDAGNTMLSKEFAGGMPRAQNLGQKRQQRLELFQRLRRVPGLPPARRDVAARRQHIGMPRAQNLGLKR